MKNIKNWIARITLLSCACLVLGVVSAQAATWTVTKIQDTNDGVCDADCSLREAIDVAAAGDRVVFSSLFNTPQTITLSPVLPYDSGLTISTNLTIIGPGADLLRVNGNPNSNNEVFEIPSGTVSLSGMTIGNGWGILNYGTTTVSECVITNNDIVVRNHAAMSIVNSTITENGGYSTGVFNDGDLTIDGSTISFNQGKGIENEGTLTVTNSTVSGNNAQGIDNDGGSAAITGSTLVYNAGEGIRADGGTVTVRNTIVAETTVGNGNDVRENVPGVIISGGYNLIGADGFSLFTAFGDQTGTFITPLDPLLDPLGDYGGMTATHRLQPNSLAIDKGLSFGLTEDQRGYQRPFDKANYPNATGGDGSDIGAYELQFTVVITGAVYDFSGNPLKNTRVSIRAINGERRAVKTDRFGIYRFNNVARNRLYQVGVTHRAYQFMPQMVMVQEENINNLNFMALP